jgi:iron uptake system component EfeO
MKSRPCMNSRHGAAIAISLVAGLVAGCASTSSGGGGATTAAATSGASGTAKVNIALTSGGCAPSPASITSGPVDFAVRNTGAGAVTEAELRTKDLAHILGEQENLTPGLSGGFSLTLDPGTYVVNCPGAHQAHWSLTVTGRATGTTAASSPALKAAVAGYARYVDSNVAGLVSHTKVFCAAIDAGDLHAAKVSYPKARVYYERIEPVAEIWGGLDTSIDGRWKNPVTVKSQFVGFHRLEQLLWTDSTLGGASSLCAGLVHHEQQLQVLVSKAQYSPLELAAGATDLINEAATAKITGEEERYSNTDFIVFAANVEAAQEVVALLTPYLQSSHAAALSQIAARHQTVMALLATYRRTPGYDETGYVDYRSVHNAARRALSGAVNAYAESLSSLSTAVSAPA